MQPKRIVSRILLCIRHSVIEADLMIRRGFHNKVACENEVGKVRKYSCEFNGLMARCADAAALCHGSGKD
ncbi:MAG: hypothetical protein K9H16_07700 [Bacteroidales bacterium]|nr:hypothetical protein [Bacteroidales bacterium]